LVDGGYRKIKEIKGRERPRTREFGSPEKCGSLENTDHHR